MIAAAYLVGVASGIAFLAVCLMWDRGNAELDALLAEDDRPDYDANLKARWLG
jgi:hypothetical protein